MLRTRAADVSLWESILPVEVLRLPEELARVDALLDDPVFFAPFVPLFDPRVGRPSRRRPTHRWSATASLNTSHGGRRRSNRHRRILGV